MKKSKVFQWVLVVLGCFCIGNGYARNPKPYVIPELQEWTGGSGKYLPREGTRIVVKHRQQTAMEVAKLFADDYKTMFGKELSVVEGNPRSGDIYFSLDPKAKLQKEGYAVQIGNTVKVTANGRSGLFWATRTLLQLAEQSESQSLPKGKIKDYPMYPVRGFMLDVGRKFFTIDFLRDYVKILSYYKINTLQIHLNDNGFAEYFNGDWDKTYAAFRLECDTYPGLTAKDGSYTKQEFIELQRLAQMYGVDIVPEIDSPAHALAFTHYRASLSSEKFRKDHLDITNPDVYGFMDKLFEEYLGGDQPVFIGKHVNIGTDEYDNKEQAVVEEFRRYTDHYIRLVEKYGKQAWLWGALTYAKGTTPVKSENVVLNLWNTGFADPKVMKEAGYKMISMNDHDLYIVPAAGYYHDYLDTEKLYRSWTPAQIGKFQFDEQDPAILGGMFAVWNDHVGNGIAAYDVHHRAFPAIQTLAVKMWTAAHTRLPYEEFNSRRLHLSEAPGVNRLGRYNTVDGKVVQIDMLKPNTETGYDGVGYDYRIRFTLDGKSEKRGTVLCESKESIFYLSDPIRGMFGFSRDGYLFTFNYRVEPDKQVKIEVEGNNRSTVLKVNGKVVDRLEHRWIKLEKTQPMANVPTLYFPLARTGNFKSNISEFEVTQIGE